MSSPTHEPCRRERDSAKLVQTARKCKSYFRNVAKLNTMRTLVVHDNDKNSDFTEETIFIFGLAPTRNL